MGNGASSARVENAVRELFAEPGRTKALEVICDLSRNEGEHDAIRKADGINALVGVLNSASDAAKTQAAEALWNLSVNAWDKDAIREAGGIEALVRVLSSGSDEGKLNAAGALRSLSVMEANRDAIREAGGIEALVGVLSSGTDEGKEEAAATIRNLSASEQNKDAIREAGGIEPLVDVVSSGTDEGKVHAVVALWNLSTNFDRNKDAIRDAGGIVALVDVLQLGPEKAKKGAASAIHQLSLKNSRNREAIREVGGIEFLFTTFTSEKESDDVKASAVAALRPLFLSESCRALILDGLKDILGTIQSAAGEKVRRSATLAFGKFAEDASSVGTLDDLQAPVVLAQSALEAAEFHPNVCCAILEALSKTLKHETILSHTRPTSHDTEERFQIVQNLLDTLTRSSHSDQISLVCDILTTIASGHDLAIERLSDRGAVGLVRPHAASGSSVVPARAFLAAVGHPWIDRPIEGAADGDPLWQRMLHRPPPHLPENVDPSRRAAMAHFEPVEGERVFAGASGAVVIVRGKEGPLRERQFALKVMANFLAAFGDDWAIPSHIVGHILRTEFDVLQVLPRHANIMRYFWHRIDKIPEAIVDMIPEDRRPAFVREEEGVVVDTVRTMGLLLERYGQTLEAWRSEVEGPVPWDRMLNLSIDLCAAIAFLHYHRVVHRDLKMDNVMLTLDKERAVVVDFGTAAKMPDDFGPDMAAPFNVINTQPQIGLGGNPDHRAPEVVNAIFHGDHRGRPEVLVPFGRQDDFALGVLLWELSEGRHPWPRYPAAGSTGDVGPDGEPIGPYEASPPLDLGREYPELFREVVSGLLRFNPSERLTSLEALQRLCVLKE